MKLYLSSYRIPVPEALAELMGKPLSTVSVALIPNAKDYYIPRAWDFTLAETVEYMKGFGMTVTVVDLREFSDSAALKEALSGHDLIWARGGNTFMLRYEMRRSGFEDIIRELLDSGVVYGGDSAGALAAGTSIAGIESADEPAFAEEVINEGLKLVPYIVMPHVDNPEFAEILPVVTERNSQDDQLIELKDSQAVIFDGDTHRIVEDTNTNK